MGPSKFNGAHIKEVACWEEAAGLLRCQNALLVGQSTRESLFGVPSSMDCTILQAQKRGSLSERSM